MVDLYRVGLVGFKEALEKADGSGLEDREAIVDLLVDSLTPENYVPDAQMPAFRVAMWREFLRFRGEDVSEFFSEAEVVVRGEPGDERDRFVATLTDVFADFELKPLIAYEPPGEDGPNPQLVINDEVVLRGNPSRQNFKAAVRKSFSGW
jgi:hypothetical protein